MLFPLARQRAIPLLVLPWLFASPVHAREDSLFTSSVTYCNPPETLLVQQFDIAYFPGNQTVAFNISAASVQADVNVTANLFLNVYGLRPFNFSIDLCSIFSGALCPLPMYNFTGADSLRLPDSLGLDGMIPSIAYRIPDLEGFAQLSLTDSDGTVRACIQSTLSNGWSTHQPAVEWTTGGIAIGMFVIAFGLTAAGFASSRTRTRTDTGSSSAAGAGNKSPTIVSSPMASSSPQTSTSSAPTLSPPPSSFPSRLLAPIPWLFLEFISLLQLIASSCLLDLNYPSAYRGFTLNFSWSLGLIPMPTPSAIQDSINNMRRATGGTVVDASGSAIEFVNRKLSPYNVLFGAIQTNGFGGGVRPVYSNLMVNPTTGEGGYDGVLGVHSYLGTSQTRPGDVQTVTESSANVLQAGVPIYVNSVGVTTPNAFMTVFLISLMLLAVVLALLALVGGVMWVVKRNGRGEKSALESGGDVRTFLVSWFIRVVLIMSFPLIMFAFYQWTLGDSWLASFIAAITFVIVFGFLGYLAFILFRLGRTGSDLDSHHLDSDNAQSPASAHAHAFSSRLYSSSIIRSLRVLPLYGLFKPPTHSLFSLFLLPVPLFRSVFISFSKSNGIVQISALLFIELLLLLSYPILRPYRERKDNVFAGIIALGRVACMGAMVAFVEQLGVAAITRVIVGFVISVVWAVMVVGQVGWFLARVGVVAVRWGKGEWRDMEGRGDGEKERR
ncbi:hypothetical protein AX16_006917 [Volvariella volvacea WC 439]|nr:hypothetical protein AX16_006917 [Volvariella volvacea WC 439]